MGIYFEVALCSKHTLEGDVSYVNDDLVLISKTYFERVKEHVLFFYPKLPMHGRYFKVICDDQLMDDELPQPEHE